MLDVQHLNAGAAARTQLVEDDLDRARLQRHLARAFGPTLLAYCLMDTHVHVVAEGSLVELRSRLNAALRAHGRDYAARHQHRCVLRGAPAVIAVEDPAALARELPYVHRNPLKTTPPLATTEVHFVWSSARACAGLSRAPFPNVARGLALLGDEARWALPPRPALADLEPRLVPTVGPPTLLAAAAQTYGLRPDELRARGHEATVMEARRVFAALGRLEGYEDQQLAPTLGRSRGRVTQLAQDHADLEAVRIARTLCHPLLFDRPSHPRRSPPAAAPNAAGPTPSSANLLR